MNKRFFVFAAMAMLSVSGAALARGDHKIAEEVAFGRPGDPKKVTRTVTLEATEIAFSTQELTFKTGETVKFVLVNKGEQNHEITIGDAAMQQTHRKMMAEMTGMSHAEMDARMPEHKMHGNSVDSEPGETKTLVWQFTKPGVFEFACNYPGHAEVGMEGKITVR